MQAIEVRISAQKPVHSVSLLDSCTQEMSIELLQAQSATPEREFPVGVVEGNKAT